MGSNRPALVLLGALALALAGPPASADQPELRPWPGPGFKTGQGSWMRPLDPDVSFTPLLTVGDSLVPPGEDPETFLFFPLPEGIGVRSLGRGVAEVEVAHGTSWTEGLGSGRVSRLLIDQKSERLLAADWIVDGYDPVGSLERLSSVFVTSTHEGFLIPQLIVNEASTQGGHHGIVAAVDLRSGWITPLPWLGRFRHAATLFLSPWGNRLVSILTEQGNPGASQLYMYLADGDADFLAGRGQLYVLRADPPPHVPDTRSASMARKSRPPLTGRFVPVTGVNQAESEASAASLEAVVQSEGALGFVRLGDAAPDRRNPNAFYIADQGEETFMDRVTGRPVTGDGRIYRIELDSFDPTVVREIRVVLDGDEADDLYRPFDLETDMKSLLIQENPERRGIRPSRLLRYDLGTRRLDVLAECAERDPQGRMIPAGTGGVWRTCGIVDASEAFGPGAWLLAVQARNDRSTIFDGRGGGGQLLLLRTAVLGEEKKGKGKKPKAKAPEDPAKGAGGTDP